MGSEKGRLFCREKLSHHKGVGVSLVGIVVAHIKVGIYSEANGRNNREEEDCTGFDSSANELDMFPRLISLRRFKERHAEY